MPSALRRVGGLAGFGFLHKHLPNTSGNDKEKGNYIEKKEGGRNNNVQFRLGLNVTPTQEIKEFIDICKLLCLFLNMLKNKVKMIISTVGRL